MMKPILWATLCGATLWQASALEILDAKVGAGDRWQDATASFKQKARVNDDLYCIYFSGGQLTGGKDPAPGKQKQLVVRYKDNDGTTQTRILAEKSFTGIAANTPAATREFTFGRAFWGDRGKWVEVTDALKKRIASGETFTLGSDAFGVADPLPGHVKYLMVFYSIDGKQYAESFRERDKFAGSAIDGSYAPIPLAKEVQSPFKGMALDRAVWQWAIDIPGAISHETDELSKAFLYIPPKTQKVRGVVVGEYNMLERPIMEHPKFREYLQKLDYGCIWIAPTFFHTPPWNGNFDHRNPKYSDAMDAMFRKLAEVSGYAELAEIPFIGIGHSAMADFGYQMAAWRPERAIAAISYDGTSPGVYHNRQYGKNPTLTPADLKKMEGIPMLQRTGGYDRKGTGNDRPLIARKHHPDMVLTSIMDPGSTHFDINDEIIDYMGKYLMKADKARGVGTMPLKKVAVKTGWRIDLWQGQNPPRTPAAPFADFKPAKTGANGAEDNWVFDAEHAKFHEAHEALYRGKKHQELAYFQNGRELPRRGDHFQVHPAFLRNKDGLSFPLKGGFMTKMTPKGAKDPVTLTHGSDPENARVYPSSGPVERISDDTVAVRFDRFGFNKSGRSHSFSLNVIHPGDAEYGRSVIQSSMGVPAANTQGIRQILDFPAIPDVKLGTKSVKLAAKVNTGLPVEYSVVYGPAWLKDGELFFTEIPPTAKFPVEVAVTAWQYGTGNEPKVQSARPVTRTFQIVR